MACAGLLSAATAATLNSTREDLQSLRKQIQQLQQDIAKGEETRDEASDDLSEVERAISAAQKDLREIVAQRQALEQEIQQIEKERQVLEARMAEHRERLGEQLYNFYVTGYQTGVRRLLSGDAPNQLARDAYYLEQIALARRAAIEAARADIERLQALLAEQEAKRSDLRKLETELAQKQKELLAQRAEHRQLLNDVAVKLSAQRKEVGSLRRDEARLTKLLKGLAELAEKAKLQPKHVNKGSAKIDGDGSPRPKVIGQATQLASAEDQGTAFAKLRGRLHWPVRGELVGRFGAPRDAGGANTWKGLFIRAQEGDKVLAVAGGQVAYADWLRGFGNLIIIDHGDGYMTIYGNNEALYKQAGEAVNAGEAVATVGASGGNQESGLYFEIRHRGQALDPMAWVSGK